MMYQASEHIQELAKSILSKEEEIVKAINERFEAEAEMLALYFSYLVLTCCTEYGNMPIHYKWVRGWDWDWDQSGELKEDGTADDTNSLRDFLSDEYSGEWEPTYTSHHGRRWLRLGDSLDYDLLNTGEDIMRSVLSKFCPDSLTEDEGFWLMDLIHDDFYHYLGEYPHLFR